MGVAASPARAAELAESALQDLALVHVRLPGGGESAVRAILAASADTRVLAHSGMSDDGRVVAMLRAGASGYLGRDAEPDKRRARVRGGRGTSASSLVGTRSRWYRPEAAR